jgi:hypothetical protein
MYVSREDISRFSRIERKRNPRLCEEHAAERVVENLTHDPMHYIKDIVDKGVRHFAKPKDNPVSDQYMPAFEYEKECNPDYTDREIVNLMEMKMRSCMNFYADVPALRAARETAKRQADAEKKRSQMTSAEFFGSGFGGFRINKRERAQLRDI